MCLKMRHFRKSLEKNILDMFVVWDFELHHIRLIDLRDRHLLLQKTKKIKEMHEEIIALKENN